MNPNRSVKISRRARIAAAAASVCISPMLAEHLSAAGTFLFDATKAESAANADWVIDADKYDLSWSKGPAVLNGGNEADAQQIPTPASSGINAYTSGTYWSGAFSSFGVGVVQQGFDAQSLPYNGSITYGNTSNPQDLSHYSAFVLSEPNILFTSAEKTAILTYVKNGGGLIIVTDHSGSDRNNDGKDSVSVVNDLLMNNSVQNNPFGVTDNAVDVSPYSTNINTSARNPLTQGPAGVLDHLTYHDGSTFTIDPTVNPSVTAAAWSGSTPSNSTAMSVYGTFGAGHFVLLGDTSPVDDGSGDKNDTSIIDGWDYDGGEQLMLNAANYVSPGNIHWFTTDGNWNTASNWFENTVPTTGNDVRFITTTYTNPTLLYDASAGTALLNSLKVDNTAGTSTLLISGNYVLNSITESIGAYGTAVVDQRNGTNLVGVLALGANSYGSGSYYLSGTGALSVGTAMIVAESGYANFTQSGGTVSLGSGAMLSVGDGTSCYGSYTMTGGTLGGQGNAIVGNYGYGAFSQTAGVVAIGAQGGLTLGLAAGGTGQYSLDGTGNLAATNEVIGNAGSGVFTQLNGTNVIGSSSVPGNLSIGLGASGYGEYDLQGGTLIVNGSESVSIAGSGNFNQTGGVHVVGTSLNVGAVSGANGFYTLTSGTLSVAGSESIGGNGGAGNFTQQGGVHVIGTPATAGTLSVGVSSTGGSGTYSISGGSLLVNGNATVGATGGLAISGGATSITGQLNVDAASQIQLTGGVLTVGSLNLNGTLAALQWTAGTLEITQGDLAISDYGLLGGSMTVGTGQLLNVDHAVNVAPNGTLNVSSATSAESTFRAGVLNNSGVVSLNTTTTNIGIARGTPALLNSGTLLLHNANLNVLGSADISGYVVSDPSNITFHDGVTLESTGVLQLSGADRFVMAGGTFTNNTTSNSNLVSNASLVFNANGSQGLVLGSPQAAALIWGSLEIGGNTTLTISGGKLLVNDLILDGNTIPDLSNVVVQNSNTISTPQSITADTSTPSNRVTFFTSTNGGFTFSNNATFTNAGSFDAECDQAFSGAGAFHNTGTFRKQVSAGTTTFKIPFNNDGLIDVRSGTLSMRSGGAGVGSVTISSGAALAVSGSPFTSSGHVVNEGMLNVAAGGAATFGSIDGGGAVSVNNAALGLNNPSTVASLILNHATLAGSAPDNVAVPTNANTLTVSGSFQDTGDLTLTNGISLNVAASFALPSSNITGGTNASFNILPGAIVTHDDAGATTFAQPAVSIAGELDVNQGTITIANGATHSGTIKVAPSAALTIGGDFTSTANVDTSGNLHLITAVGTATNYNLPDSGGRTFSGALTVEPGVNLTVQGSGDPAGALFFANNSVVQFGANATLNVLDGATALFQNQQTINLASATLTGHTVFQNTGMNFDNLTINGVGTTETSFVTGTVINVGTLNHTSGIIDSGPGYSYGTSLNVGVYNFSGGDQQSIITLNDHANWTGGRLDANGELFVSDAATLSISGDGGVVNGSAYLKNSGAINASGNLVIGADGQGYANLDAFGGTISVSGILALGNAGSLGSGTASESGLGSVYGGVLNAGGIVVGNKFGGSGYFSDGSGTVTVGGGGITGNFYLYGGTVSVMDQSPPAGADSTVARSIVEGYQQDGTLYVDGGTLTTPNIKLGVTAGNTGYMNQYAGEVDTGTLSVGCDGSTAAGAGTGIFSVYSSNFNAGTILVGSDAGGAGSVTFGYGAQVTAGSIRCGGTAAANSAALEIYGVSVSVGTLDASTASQFLFTWGSLSISHALYTPATGLTIGDGTSPALLALHNASVFNGPLAIAAASTLSGSGTFNSSVAVNPNGTLAPGNGAGDGVGGVGKMAFYSGLSLATDTTGSSILQLEIGSAATPGATFDQMIIKGGVFTVGGATLQLVPLSGLQLNTPYAIVVADGGSIDYSNEFSNLANGTDYSAGLAYHVSYSTGEIDVTFSAVPEPVALLPLAGMAMLLRRKRRERQ